MSIPLDRLYYYIESIAREVRESNVIIYHFYPHGSKKLEDLTYLRQDSWKTQSIAPHIYCNDQEPLDYDFYAGTFNTDPRWKQLILDSGIELPDLNMRRGLMSIYDKCLLLHSEQRSENVRKYANNNFIPVYYWSHAVIARDWFRYAKHITQSKQVDKTFLVYNRAWSGTREYRLGFANRLIVLGLVNCTKMRISPVDSTIDKHYDLHQFEHSHWRPNNVIENYFPLCEAESHYSADFDLDDYESTDIEVVLETLFDDLRLHLTEKTLRPIAIGQPFILAGTYGSLKYLRKYGFKTFGDCWDESYDMMSDSIERMNKITDVMNNIVSMSASKREEILIKARDIAEYNKQHFFSDKFQNQIADELKHNLTMAFNELESTNTSRRYLEWRKLFSIKPLLKPHLVANNNLVVADRRTRKDIAEVIHQARQYYIRSLSQD
jgi:hypothetical protein